jgi:hypothetical protein
MRPDAPVLPGQVFLAGIMQSVRGATTSMRIRAKLRPFLEAKKLASSSDASFFHLKDPSTR